VTPAARFAPHPLFDAIALPHMELIAEALTPHWPTRKDADIWHKAS
jgi:hypothetical protein